MSKTFTCCGLVKRIKESQEAPSNNWPERDKYLANELLWKATLKVYKQKKESGEEEEVWDSPFCEKCEKWFTEQRKLQIKLIDAQIEKEKAEGTFYSKPEVQEILKEKKQKFDKWEKELGLGNSKPNFGKSPQE